MAPPTNLTEKGRYSQPVPVYNLKEFGDDFAEFELFDGVDEATPRSFPGGAMLRVDNVDMCQHMNKPQHFTDRYDTPNLVIRRGQEFHMQVTFNRELVQQDDFQLEFLIGSNPAPHKGSLVVVTFGTRRGNSWTGRILEMKGGSVMLGITPTADAIVGKYRTYVAISAGSGMQRTKRNTTTDLYILFNAWCPDDQVFLPDSSERMEYVMNDVGIICQGTIGAMLNRSWSYGQFERGILDACIYILDSSRMPIYNRGNVIKVVRKGSAMVNSQDDNGVLVGNWSNDYSMGRPPTSWTGSTSILLQYAKTGVPVCYGQCWVFAGVFCTFLRCLGIPTRIITNFSSAHDNTGNLKTDLIFKSDGSPDRRNTRDSIWNYHCWNECWMTRPDLPAGYGGWQIVDSTPQETSDGHYRCGPASVIAIKEGNVCQPFDCGFVFAEVNSDVVFHKRDRYGTMQVFKVDKTHIGQGLFTKALGVNQMMDVTHTYKHPEGSEADTRSMTQAETFGCGRDHSDVPAGHLSAEMTSELCHLGSDIELMVSLTNHGDINKTITCHLEASVVFYTGVEANHIKNLDFPVTVAAKQKNGVIVKIRADEYMPRLEGQLSICFILTGSSEDQLVSAIKLVTLQNPMLTLAVSGQPRIGQQIFVTVTFTNPLKEPLENVSMYLEGPGVMAMRKRYFAKIEPQASISWVETCEARLDGKRYIIAVMHCDKMQHVNGFIQIFVSPPALTYPASD